MLAISTSAKFARTKKRRKYARMEYLVHSVHTSHATLQIRYTVGQCNLARPVRLETRLCCTSGLPEIAFWQMQSD